MHHSKRREIRYLLYLIKITIKGVIVDNSEIPDRPNEYPETPKEFPPDPNPVEPEFPGTPEPEPVKTPEPNPE